MSRRGSWVFLAIWCLGRLPSWSLDLNFDPGTGPNSNVLALAVQADDSVLVGGLFTEFDGTPRSGIARLHPTGHLDAGLVVSPELISSIGSIAIQEDGKLLLASTIPGPGGAYVTRVHQDGTTDGTFAAAANGPVHVVTTGPDGAIWIGGGFTEVNGVPRNRVAKLHVTGEVDPVFDPGVGPNRTVFTLLPDDAGGVLLGGAFYLFGEFNVGRVIRLESNGVFDTNFYSTVGRNFFGPVLTNYSVRCLARDPLGRIIAGGEFTLSHPTLPFVPISGVVRLLPQGAVDLDFTEPLHSAFGTMGNVYSVLREPDGRSVVAGAFSTFNGVTRSNLVRLLPDGSLDDCFPGSPGALPDGPVHAVARQSTGRVLIGGAFTAIGNVPRPFLAALPSTQPPFAPPTLELISEYGWPRAAIGGNSKITARATSCSGWLSYQWFKDGGALPGEIGPSLVLNHPDARHSGRYFVVVSNPAGATTSSVVRLDVGGLDVDFDTSNGPLNWSVPQVYSAVWSILPLRNGQVLVGGPFLQVEGQDWPHLARLDADGSLDRTFTAWPNAVVRAMAEQPDGKVVISGEFNGVNVQYQDRVARLEPDGSLDTNFTVRLGRNGVMRALDLQPDGKVMVGGAFHVPRTDAPWIHNLIRLDAGGAIDFTFDPGTNFVTTAIDLNHVKGVQVLADGAVMVGGTFTRSGGASRDYLARVRPDGSVDPRFGVEPFPGPNGPLYCMAREPGGLTLIAGSFTRVHGMTRTNLARLLPDGSVDESFVPPPAPRAGYINALAADAGGRVWVVYSSLNTFGDPSSSQIYRYDAQGRLDTNYVAPVMVRAGTAAAIHTLVPMENGGIYVGGTFETVDGVIRRRVARLLGDAPGPPVFTSQPADLITEPALDLAINATVTLSGSTSFQWFRDGETIPDGTNAVLVLRYALPVHSGPYWLVASNAYGATTSAVALVTVKDPQRPGAVDLSFAPDPGANSNVWALAETAGGQLVIGGDFTQVDRTDVTQIARLNADGRLDSTFRPLLYPLNGSRPAVRALFREQDGTVLAGGDFIVSAGTASSLYLGRIRSNGSIDSSLSCLPGTTFSSMPVFPPIGLFALNGEAFFLGGLISNAGGRTDLRYVLRLDKNGFLDTRFKTGIQGFFTPLALACDDEGHVLLGGYYALQRLTPSGALDPSFNVLVSKMDPCPNGGNLCDNTINRGRVLQTLVQPDGKLVIAGYFEKVNNVFRRHVARLNSDGTVDSTFSPALAELDSEFYALALQPDGKLLIGGTFTNLGPVVRNRIARLNLDGSIDESFDLGVGANADVRSILLLKDGRIAVGGRFTRFNGYPRSRVAVLHGGPVEAPAISGSATNIEVVSGRALTFAPLLHGYPPPTLQWLFNGIPLAGETNVSLRTAPIRVGDAGIYSLVASNTSGVSTAAVATVAVNAPALEGGVIDPGFFAGTGADGDVHSVVVQEDGRIVLGGAFQRVHGIARAGIARLLADGSLDQTFDPGAALSEMPSNSIRVSRIVRQLDGKLLVSGNFSIFDGVTRGGCVRLDADGTLDLDFPDVGGWPLLVQPDGKILMGGNTTYLRRLHLDGSLDSSFNAETNLDNLAQAAALQPDGKIVVVGSFTRSVLRLMPDGSKDSMFDCGVTFGDGSSSDPCFGVTGGGSAGGRRRQLALAVQPDGRILVGGHFGSYGGLIWQINLIRLLASGAPDPDFSFGRGPGFAVRTVTLQRDGRILIGGCFTNVGEWFPGVPRDHIARLNPDGSVDSTFNPGAGYANSGDGWVEAIALQTDGRILLGGRFSHVDGERRSNIARLGGSVQMFDPAKDGGTFTTRIATVEGRTYWLEAKTALSDAEWTVIANTAGDGSVQTLTDSAGGDGPRYYRIRAE